MSFKSVVNGAAFAALFAGPALAEIEIHDAYARSSNPMAGAAFMVIHNHGGANDRLVGVRSDAAQRVELHTHKEDPEGVMRMIHVEEGFDLPTDGEIIMKRGGDHVMFMGLTEPFEDDMVVTVTFEFEQAGDVVVEIPVDQDRLPAGGMDHSGHGDHDHSDHDHGDHDHGDHDDHDDHEGHDH